MTIELVHSELGEVERKRVFRLMADARLLRASLTLAQIRGAYADIEIARDLLSDILDRVDGKD